MKYLLNVLIFLCTVPGLYAQIPRELVYLHTDRDVFAPSDELKFKAYLKKSDNTN